MSKIFELKSNDFRPIDETKDNTTAEEMARIHTSLVKQDRYEKIGILPGYSIEAMTSASKYPTKWVWLKLKPNILSPVEYLKYWLVTDGAMITSTASEAIVASVLSTSYIIPLIFRLHQDYFWNEF